MKGSTSCLLHSWEKNSGEVLPVGSQQTISCSGYLGYLF
jgi:hypothetical protein